jgi:hypothetical protein
MTCSRRARPPTSCSTLGRLLLSRVPLPAAMIATAKPVASMPAIFSRERCWLHCNERSIIEASEVPMATNSCSGQRVSPHKLSARTATMWTGRVQERNLGERDHADLQMRLAYLLCHAGERRLRHSAPRARVQVSPTRFRVPDVCVLRKSAPREQIVDAGASALHRNTLSLKTPCCGRESGARLSRHGSAAGLDRRSCTRSVTDLRRHNDGGAHRGRPASSRDAGSPRNRRHLQSARRILALTAQACRAAAGW